MAANYYRSFTIDHTKCGSGNSTDFPVLINTTNAATATKNSFKTVGNSGNVQNASGFDIRPFSDSALTTPLSFELVTYAATTGIFEMWVKIPTLSSSVDTVIYLSYGDSSISTNGSSTATWNSVFKGVYHFPNGSSLTLADSTSNANNATNNGLTAGTGQIDGGAVDGGTAGHNITPGTFSSMTQITWSCWFKTSATTNRQTMIGSDNGGRAFMLIAPQTFDVYYNYDNTGYHYTSAANVCDGIWHHIAVTHNGTSIAVYLDGSQLTTSTVTVSAGMTTLMFASDSNFNILNGTIDEIHIGNAARNTDWILSEYNNQNIPDKNITNGFYTVGAETATSIIQFDAAANSGYQAASSSYTFNRTCTGTNRYLTVDVSLLSAGQTVTSIQDDTAGGNVNLIFIGARSTVSSVGRIESWGLVAPATGTKTIQVNLSGSIASSSVAVSYTGVHQSISVESFNSNQATNVGAADATVTITPITDQCWIHAAIATDDTAIVAGQTTRNNVTGAGGSGANEDTGPITPASGTVMTYTSVGALATWAIAGYALRPYTATGAATSQLLMLLGVGK